MPELVRLAEAGGTPLAVVELWDSVEPKAMAEVVTAGGFTVAGVVTAVDPALVLPYLGNGDDLAEGGLAAAATDQRTVADTFARQLEYASVLALAEPLPGSPEADDEDRELLAQLHPTARRVPIGHGNPAGTPPAGPELARAALAGFDVEAAAAAQHPACALLPAEADAHGVATLVWHRRRPFHPERLYAALEDLTCAAARSRGGSGWPARGTRCCTGTPRAVPCAWRARGRGSPRSPTPRGSWCRRCAAPPPRWTGTPSTATAASTWSSPPRPRPRRPGTAPGVLPLTDAEYAAGQAAWDLLPPAFDTLLEV